MANTVEADHGKLKYLIKLTLGMQFMNAVYAPVRKSPAQLISYQEHLA